MPEVIVKIEWDHPDEVTWLPPGNIELCLNNMGRSTRFKVSSYDPPEQDKVFMKVGEQEVSLQSLVNFIAGTRKTR